MADSDDLTEGARFQSQVAARPHVNELKGAGALDWGMQSRLARIFQPSSNRAVMLAIDHGYFQGPTSGLERVDLSIVPLLPYLLGFDALGVTLGLSALAAIIGGGLVARLTNRPFWRGALRQLILGTVAAGLTYLIGLGVGGMATSA